MPSVRDRYRRLDARVRTLSRTQYALTIGVLTFAATLGVSTLLGDPELFQATMMGVTFTAIYYVVNPNRSAKASE